MGDGAADVSEPDDAHRRTCQPNRVIVPQRDIVSVSLSGCQLLEAACKVDEHPERVLRDGGCVCATRVGEDHVAFDDRQASMILLV